MQCYAGTLERVCLLTIWRARVQFYAGTLERVCLLTIWRARVQFYAGTLERVCLLTIWRARVQCYVGALERCLHWAPLATGVRSCRRPSPRCSPRSASCAPWSAAWPGRPQPLLPRRARPRPPRRLSSARLRPRLRCRRGNGQCVLFRIPLWWWFLRESNYSGYPCFEVGFKQPAVTFVPGPPPALTNNISPISAVQEETRLLGLERAQEAKAALQAREEAQRCSPCEFAKLRRPWHAWRLFGRNRHPPKDDVLPLVSL